MKKETKQKLKELLSVQFIRGLFRSWYVDAPPHQWVNALSRCSFFEVARPVPATLRNEPGSTPDEDAHRSDAHTYPRIQTRPEPTLPPHRTARSPPTTPIAADAPDCPRQIQTHARFPTSPWPLRATAQSTWSVHKEILSNCNPS